MSGTLWYLATKLYTTREGIVMTMVLEFWEAIQTKISQVVGKVQKGGGVKKIMDFFHNLCNFLFVLLS